MNALVFASAVFPNIFIYIYICMFVLLDLLLVSVSHLLRQVDGVNRTLQTLLRYVVDSLNDLSTDGLDLGSLTLTNEPWLQRHFFPLNHEFKCFSF